MITLMSWNVNGIRAVVKKGFEGFLKEHKPDVLGLQEIKINDAARAQEKFDFAAYNEYWHPAERSGYSGTATLSKLEPISIGRGFSLPGQSTTIGDKEGRLQTFEFDKFYFLNAYFPNANHELTRLGFKEEFNKKFLQHVKKLEKKKPVVACGDFNVAHQEIDLARPKDNIGNPGFTKEERDWADKLVKHGLIDTFRHLHPDKVQYSWWSYRNFVRERNIGWRIDYFFASKELMSCVKKAFILDQVLGSDHCPVGIQLDI
ncbi:MAG: exodeoxyribonuclease III [Patescibacteria group bacterium]|nr:exodeoxyribonuclease III [Patescibacteria group bacterium]